MNELSIQEVLNNRNSYNLALPFVETQQVNPFYKMSVSQLCVDMSETYKVGSRNSGNNGWEDLYSLKKEFLQKLATEAGIQFAPGAGDVVKVDENTWKASAYGALKLPDGNVRSSSDFKVIDLATEEMKYRLSYEEKAANGIIDYKAAKEASEKYSGHWENTGIKNDKGYPVKKYIIDSSERTKYIEKSLLDAMAQLRANAPQKAATGAILRVIRALLGIKGTYTTVELKKPFAVARISFSPDYSDPLVKQMMLQQAMQSVGNLFGNTQPVVQTISIPQTQDIEDEVDIPADADSFQTAGDNTEQTNQQEVYQEQFSVEQNVPEQRNDFYCDKCGEHISEKVWDYSVEKFQRPLCYKCQKIVKGEGK